MFQFIQISTKFGNISIEKAKSTLLIETIVLNAIESTDYYVRW